MWDFYLISNNRRLRFTLWNKWSDDYNWFFLGQCSQNVSPSLSECYFPCVAPHSSPSLRELQSCRSAGAINSHFQCRQMLSVRLNWGGSKHLQLRDNISAPFDYGVIAVQHSSSGGTRAWYWRPSRRKWWIYPARLVQETDLSLKIHIQYLKITIVMLLQGCSGTFRQGKRVWGGWHITRWLLRTYSSHNSLATSFPGMPGPRNQELKSHWWASDAK